MRLNIKYQESVMHILKKDNEAWKLFEEKFSKILKEQEYKITRLMADNFRHLVIADDKASFLEMVKNPDDPDILHASTEKDLKTVHYNGTFQLIIHPHILNLINQHKRRKNQKKKTVPLSKFHIEAMRLLTEEGSYHAKKTQFISNDEPI